ncbi:MAG: peptide ligase PGM1-related protein, partial [Pseudomonadota bacterium]
DAGPEDADAIAGRLPDLGFEAAGMTWPLFAEKLAEMGGIVEAFVEGAEKRSPSVQYRVDPAGALSAISTHDQVLGGAEGGVFLGCTFPADPAYRLAIQEAGRPAAEALRDAGVLGRFGIDFISVKAGDGWRHYAIEVNLRKGGTTHPFLMLQMLTDGAYEEKSGLFRTRGGEARYYRATDNLEAPEYRGLSPDDLIDIALRHDLHFHSGAGRGVVFHLIGALSEYGKLGAVAVGESPEAAAELYATAVAALDLECGRNGG